MLYTYESLKETAAEARKKSGAGTASPLGTAVGTAAGYAAAFLKRARSANVPLRFDILDEDQIPRVAAVIHLNNLRDGKSTAESREDITRQMAGFELFAILNSFNREEENVEPVLPGPMSGSPLPLLRALPKPDQHSRVFDVYAAMKKTAESFVLGESYTEDGRVFQGRMNVFREAFTGFVASTRK